MNIEQACRKWINEDFSMIPMSLIKKAYKDNPEELILLSKEYSELDYPACWGWVFVPDNPFDKEWIKDNIAIVEKYGFLIYESEDIDVMLIVDNDRYSFYNKHWIPLYRARGFNWHGEELIIEEEKEAI